MNTTSFLITSSMNENLRKNKKKARYDCCKHHLLYAGCVEFHEWDEVFNAEITTLVLNMFQCEFCHQSYYLEEE